MLTTVFTFSNLHSFINSNKCIIQSTRSSSMSKILTLLPTQFIKITISNILLITMKGVLYLFSNNLFNAKNVIED